MIRKKLILDHLVHAIESINKNNLNILSIGPGDLYYEKIIYQRYKNKIKKFILTDIVNIEYPDYFDFFLYKDLNKNYKYDLVILIDVIEHTPNLLEFSNQIVSMSEEGKLFIGTPNIHRLYNIFLLFLNKLSFPRTMGNGWQSLGFSKEADIHNFELTKEILVSLFNSKNNIKLNEVFFSKLSSLLNRSDYLILT